MTKSVTQDDLKKIASLAKLSFSDAELQKYTEEFNNIVAYVSQVMECDVEGVEAEHNLKGYKDVHTILQEDEVFDYGLTRDNLLQNATEGREKNGYIVVKGKILNKEE